MFVESLESRRMLAGGSGANWVTLWFDGERTRVGLTTASGKSATLRAGRATWVVMPGWTADLTTSRRLAQAIDRTSRKDQVVILDWTDAAASTGVVSAAGRAPDVARWVANTLRRRGIAALNINLVGHSLGGYMADAVARHTGGGVNRIVALDPATPDATGASIAGMNFAARSRFSLAFVGSRFASAGAAFTADETVRLNVGDFNSTAAHAAVPELFASMVIQSTSARPGKISPLFSVSRLSATARPRWKANAFDGGYEARLLGASNAGQHHPETLTYVPRRRTQEVTITS